MRSWRRQLHLWDSGSPANAAADDGACPVAQGGSACEGIDGEDGEFDPIMMEEDDGEAGWEDGPAHDEAIDNE